MNSLKKKNNGQLSEMDRRTFFTGLGSFLAYPALSSTGILLPSSMATAATDNYFFLQIETSSMCGRSLGPDLWNKPTTAGGTGWVKGQWSKTAVNAINNPLLDAHTVYQYGSRSMTFHTYSKVLMDGDIPKNLAFTQNKSVGVGHGTTHQDRGGNKNNCTFATGFAQAAKGSASVALVSGGHNPNAATPNVVSIPATSYSTAFKDSVGGLNSMASLWSTYRTQNFNQTIPGLVEASEALGIATYMDNFAKGVPPALLAGSTEELEVKIYVNKSRVFEKLRAHIGADDATETGKIIALFNLQPEWTALINDFVIAGVLALTGFSKSMTTRIRSNHDLHNPGPSGSAEVFTARAGALTWAIFACWVDYIKAKKLEDKVLVRFVPEFSRTPMQGRYGQRDMGETVVIDGASTKIMSSGFDHSPYTYNVWWGGRVPGCAKFGSFGENFTAFGSSDANGVFDPNIPLPKSADLVGSMFMKCFPELFPPDDLSRMRSFWADFSMPLASILNT